MTLTHTLEHLIPDLWIAQRPSLLAKADGMPRGNVCFVATSAPNFARFKHRRRHPVWHTIRLISLLSKAAILIIRLKQRTRSQEQILKRMRGAYDQQEGGGADRTSEWYFVTP